jgi:hypothetical protein
MSDVINLNEDFTDFIIKNNVFNLEKLTKNGMKTGSKTKFYKEHESTFNRLMAKHKQMIF